MAIVVVWIGWGNKEGTYLVRQAAISTQHSSTSDSSYRSGPLAAWGEGTGHTIHPPPPPPPGWVSEIGDSDRAENKDCTAH